MQYNKKESYQEIKINLKREGKGSDLINYLEKAATVLVMYTEKTYQRGCIAVIPILEEVNMLISHFLVPFQRCCTFIQLSFKCV